MLPINLGRNIIFFFFLFYAHFLLSVEINFNRIETAVDIQYP
jgi:hypothetical protein